MSKEFLPLGSAIKWKEDEASIYVIMSRAFMQPPEEELIAGYQCVLYPEGYGKNNKVYIIKEPDILEVLTAGYSDELDRDFMKQKLEELTERIKNAPSTAPISEESEVVISKQSVLIHEEMLAKDPFYKFRK